MDSQDSRKGNWTKRGWKIKFPLLLPVQSIRWSLPQSCLPSLHALSTYMSGRRSKALSSRRPRSPSFNICRSLGRCSMRRSSRRGHFSRDSMIGRTSRPSRQSLPLTQRTCLGSRKLWRAWIIRRRGRRSSLQMRCRTCRSRPEICWNKIRRRGRLPYFRSSEMSWKKARRRRRRLKRRRRNRDSCRRSRVN